MYVFVCETLQMGCKSVTVLLLKFEGSVVSMPVKTRLKRGRDSTEIALLSKLKGLLRRKVPRREIGGRC